jgi:hypothetical protein
LAGRVVNVIGVLPACPFTTTVIFPELLPIGTITTIDVVLDDITFALIPLN